MGAYRAAFGQLPDNGGFDYWVGTLQESQCIGWSQVNAQATNIVWSFMLSYYSPSRTHRQFVGDLYDVFYQRAPDLGGFNYWSSQLETGARDRTNVLQQFLGPEWVQRVNAMAAEPCIP
jgi:serralysin